MPDWVYSEVRDVLDGPSNPFETDAQSQVRLRSEWKPKRDQAAGELKQGEVVLLLLRPADELLLATLERYYADLREVADASGEIPFRRPDA